MKALKIFLITAMIAVLFAAPISSVQAGSPPGTWVSGISCQNLDSENDAAIVIAFYPENNSSAVLTYNDTILKGGNKNYYTPSTPPGIPAGFVGSAVVSSSTALACNVNTITTGAGTTTDPIRLGINSGFDEVQVAPVMYLPQIEKAFYDWNSYIAVQNTNADPVDVTITYKDRYGVAVPSATETATIPANTNKVFYQSDNANLPSNFLGSAKVAADDGTSPLAVIANFYNSGTNNTTAQIHSYNGFSQGGSKVYAPYIVRNYYGYNGGISIQNIGTDVTTVRITFMFGTHEYIYDSPEIESGAALPLYTPNISELNEVDTFGVKERFGSAVIEVLTGGPIVAIINESNFGGPGVVEERVGQGGTYNAFVDGTQTNTVFLPQIPRNAGGIWSGGFQVTNTADSEGTCDIAYEGVPAAFEDDVPLPALGSISRYAPGVTNLPDGFNKSVTVTCTQPIFGIANLAINPGSGKYGDTFGQSNGLNR